jgi:hypothetical protein
LPQQYRAKLRSGGISRKIKTAPGAIVGARRGAIVRSNAAIVAANTIIARSGRQTEGQINFRTVIAVDR